MFDIEISIAKLGTDTEALERRYPELDFLFERLKALETADTVPHEDFAQVRDDLERARDRISDMEDTIAQARDQLYTLGRFNEVPKDLMAKAANDLDEAIGFNGRNPI